MWYKLSPQPLSPQGRGETGRYVTFVNPHPQKGLFVFARIARELWQRRPDIPLRVVEGRAKRDRLRDEKQRCQEPFSG